MEEISVREIKCEDYRDIYLLNQEFNPKRSDFSAEKVKERITFCVCMDRDIAYQFVIPVMLWYNIVLE